MSNLSAFLAAIAAAEGTADLGDRGYDVVVGSTAAQTITFNSYRDHPRIRVVLSQTLTSDAAGRYQILSRIHDAYRRQLRLPDFSPTSQDAIATQLLRECGALASIEAGRFEQAVAQARTRWASLPGAGYGQPERPLDFLMNVYTQFGGKPAA